MRRCQNWTSGRGRDVGSLFLTLDSARGPVVSGHALAVTFGWLAAAMAFGVVAGIPLARTVAAARGPAA